MKNRSDQCGKTREARARCLQEYVVGSWYTYSLSVHTQIKRNQKNTSSN